MVALPEGTKAPDFTLNGLNGSKYSLYQTLRRSPRVLMVFFKVSCPVCQLEFPYLERLHRGCPTLPLWGISQDDADATTAFSKMYGITFPILLDEGLANTVNYGLTNVPSLFIVGDSQNIIQTTVGFVKAELEKANMELATAAGITVKPMFTAADEVPALKPG